MVVGAIDQDGTHAHLAHARLRPVNAALDLDQSLLGNAQAADVITLSLDG